MSHDKSPSEIGLRVNGLCDRFEASWRAGERPCLEDFVANVAEPYYTPLLRELILLDMDYRRLAGQASSVMDYQARFPTLPLGDLQYVPLDHEIGLAGRFELREEVGRGGMGVVLRAYDPDCRRDVAVKVLQPRRRGVPTMERRFIEEAQLTSQLQHPGIPPVYEVGRLIDGRPFFAMKLVQGRTLAELLRERKSPQDELSRWVSVFRAVCQAVGYAHCRGIIHRDLKPSNIMVGLFGEVQVMDWGLAKRTEAIQDAAGVEPAAALERAPGGAATLSEAESCDGAVMGTPAYMPPEQARGEVRTLDARSDVFGLGAILCEILTGSPPFTSKGDNAAVGRAASADLAGSLARIEASGADEELIRVARACLTSEQQARPAHAGIVAEAIAAHEASVERRLRQAELERAAARVRAWEVRKRRRLRLALAVCILAVMGLLAAGAAWRAWQRDQAQREAEAMLELAGDLQSQYRWAEARKALTQAAARLDILPAALQERVQNASADLEWSARLDAVRLARLTIADGRLHPAAAAKEYAALFREAGLDPAAEPAQTVEKIKASAIRQTWVAALDDWAQAAQDRELRGRLLLVSRDADADRDAWRDRLRSSESWESSTALRALVDPAKVDAAGPQLATVLGLRLHATGGNAIEMLRSAQRRHARDFWLNLALGTLLLSEGGASAHEAVGYLRAAIALRPDSAVVHNNLAAGLEKCGEHAAAMAALNEALRLDPAYAKAHNNLGVLLMRSDRLDDAIAEFRNAVRLDPENDLAWRHLGQALSRKGLADEAKEAIQAAHRLNPKLADHNLGTVLTRLGEMEAAEKACREAIQRDPGDPDGHFNLGNLLVDCGNAKEAIEAYRETLRLDPGHVRAHCNMAMALAGLGMLDEAVVALREALDKDPRAERVQYNLGFVLAARGAFEEAVTAYRAALKLNPRQATTHNNLGAALSRLGRVDEAIAAYREALRLDPLNAATCCNLGMASAKNDAPDEAIAAFRAALRIQPGHGKASYNLAVALARKRQHADAVVAYRRAFAHEPRYLQAAFNLGEEKADPELRFEQAAPPHLFRDGIRLDFRIEHDLLGANQVGWVDRHADAATTTSIFSAIEPLGLPPIHPELQRAPDMLASGMAAGGRAQETPTPSREVVVVDPLEARALFNLGNALLGSADDAVSAFEHALQLDKEFAPAHANLGIALVRKKDFKGALAAYRQAIRLDPANAATHSNLGVALARTDKLDDAVASFREAIRLHPELALAHCNLANALMARSDLDGAATSFREALRLDGNDAHAHTNLGLCLARQGLHQEAVDAHRDAVRLDANLAAAHNNLGMALVALGKLDDAVAAYRRAIYLDAKEASAHTNLGLALLEKGHLEAAIDACLDGVRLGGGNALAHYNVGVAYQKKGMLAAAISAYEAALRHDAKMAAAHCNLALAYGDKGLWASAAEAGRAAVNLDPSLSLAHLNLAIALDKLGDVDAAIAANREAIRLDPRLTAALCNLGVGLRRKNRLDDAIAALRQAVDSDPNLGRGHFNLGNALVEKGDLAAAVEAFRRAMAVEPEFAEAHCNLGLALAARGRLSEAIEALERGHELGATAPDWKLPSHAWLTRCKAMNAIAPKLADYLNGKRKPADAAEALAMGDLLAQPYQKRYADAARFFDMAFAADPRTAGSLKAGWRYMAACVAVRAADHDPAGKEFRAMALRWLQADLALWGRQLSEGSSEARAEARRVLRGWLSGQSLGGVRDEPALASMPVAEREAWQKLWADVAEFSAEKKAPS